MLDAVKRVAQIASHADRARAASELLTDLQASVTETARLRRESIAWLREQGYSLAAIADIIGVSRARIAQLREAGPPPERAFLGTDRLTVAIPLKTEATSGRPVVAQEDFAAGHWLLEDHRTGQRYPSPSDLPQPRPADVGYLSRLPRPDGNGTFILLTGIHAVGSHGIIDFLRRELADLYEQVDLQPFSTLIAMQVTLASRRSPEAGQ